MVRLFLFGVFFAAAIGRIAEYYRKKVHAVLGPAEEMFVMHDCSLPAPKISPCKRKSERKIFESSRLPQRIKKSEKHSGNYFVQNKGAEPNSASAPLLLYQFFVFLVQLVELGMQGVQPRAFFRK